MFFSNDRELYCTFPTARGRPQLMRLKFSLFIQVTCVLDQLWWYFSLCSIEKLSNIHVWLLCQIRFSALVFASLLPCCFPFCFGGRSAVCCMSRRHCMNIIQENVVGINSCYYTHRETTPSCCGNGGTDHNWWPLKSRESHVFNQLIWGTMDFQAPFTTGYGSKLLVL